MWYIRYDAQRCPNTYLLIVYRNVKTYVIYITFRMKRSHNFIRSIIRKIQ